MELKRLISVIPIVVTLLSASFAQAALNYSGNLNPADPAAWTSSTDAYVGQTTDGSLTVDSASTVTSRSAYLGYNAGITGTATVTGSGSKWTTAGSSFYIGNNGTGVLNITNGGAVSNDNNSWLGYNTGSSGTVNVDGTGSTWSNWNIYVGNNGTGTLNITNGSSVTAGYLTRVGALGTINFSNGGTLTTGILFAGSSQLSGAGTINTSGIIGDMNLVFNASHGATQSFAVNGVTVNLTQSSSKPLGVGYLGSGTLNISDGVTVASSAGYVGYGAGSTGTATVGGTGSRWANGSLYVGYNGAGTLNITNRGAVAASGDLNVGYNASGALKISNGGTVSVTGATKVGKPGTINFGGSNGNTLTTGTLYASSSQLSGTGTINTSGIVSDMNLAFNATHGAKQSFTINGVTVNLSQSSTKDLGVGYLGSGSLSISEGVQVSSHTGYLGYMAGSTGTATIDGANSRWINNGNVTVGYYGNGTLNITNGGSGNFASDVTIGGAAGSTGVITVDGAGSFLGTKTFYIGSSGTGTLKITNGGNVISGTGNIGIGTSTGSAGSAIVSGANTRWTTTAANLWVGWGGTGSLTINNGGRVDSRSSVIGAYSGVRGTVIVDGVGSTWNNSSGIIFGYSGTGIGRLTVKNGGTVTSSTTSIGSDTSGIGVAIVDGAGSNWTNSSSSFAVGQSGVGKLSVSNGGVVASAGMSINNLSTLTTDVGKGSSVAVSGTLTNNGTIRLVAGASAANGTYTPITAGTWAGIGAVQALGGIWDPTNHTVTVSSAALTAAGEAKTIDLANTQRFLFTNSESGKSIGVAFQGTTTSTPLTMTASEIDGAELTPLQSLLEPGKSVLSAWDLTVTEGYTSGDPVYLSLSAGNATSLYDLTVWHFDGSTWSKFDATDLAYDGKYASFSVNGFSAYAVSGTAPVPIPAAAWLLGSGLMGLVGLRRRMGS